MSAMLSPRHETFYGRHGLRPPLDAEPVRAGRNSEVLRLSNQDGAWILKNYFRHPSDQRDRLGAEFGFLRFLNNHGMTGVPRAIGMERDLYCALYSLLPGTRPRAIGVSHISQAAAFILALQQLRETAAQLPLAAEACLSWQAHADVVTRRIERLLQIKPDSNLHSAAQLFVRDTLAPAWQRLLGKLSDAATPAQWRAELAPDARILSPSDFGFHNTLEHEQRLAFVDFEYAGWDDPAKLVCDFICQPEVAVTAEQGRQFADALLTGLFDDGSIAHRIARLTPLHRIKWCCILLNEFRNEDRQRRLHAGAGGDALLETQLEKAQDYFRAHCPTSE